MEIAQKRASIERDLKAALLDENNELALQIARLLVNVDEMAIARHREEKARSTRGRRKSSV